MDPFAILGVEPDVSERELAAAYRRAAKRWHPDRRGGGDRRMALLNTAYEAARRALQAEPSPAAEIATRRRPRPGAWLPERLRTRIGWELLSALSDGENVQLVIEAGGTGRGPALLVLTDRRLLWLLEDAVSARVDWVRFAIVADVRVRRSLLRRGRRSLHVRTRTGRRLVFGDLEPASATAIARRLAP